MDELVKECYSNISDLGVELICWVRGKEFIINLNSIAEILHITRPQNVNLTPYDDRTPEIQDILQVLGPDHEVSSKGISISTAKFAPELTTLKLIMFPIFTRCPTRLSSISEELNSYVILLQERPLIFVPTSFKP